MSIIHNTWVEKAKKKVEKTVAPAYARQDDVSDILVAKKPTKRFTLAARSYLIRTLRGVRR